MPKHRAASEISKSWNIGFELEVILGDLGSPHYKDYVSKFEPMDEATPGYCQTLAKKLSSFTGRKWVAPRSNRVETGFYVVPEYDIDPCNFQYANQLAGVELITPPLPITEAEALREEMVSALFELDGYSNEEFDESTASLGWHVNIDPGDGKAIEAASYACGVDEVEILLRSGRLGGKMTGLQRHSFGPHLLRELSTANSFISSDNDGANLVNFLSSNIGKSKYYAANFSRNHYLELRHFSTPDFFNESSIEELLDEPLRALEMGRANSQAALNHLVETFKVLRLWLDEYEEKITIKIHEAGRTNFRNATIFFGEQDVGSLTWFGQISVEIWGKDRYVPLVGAWGHAQSNLKEVFAVLCLDIADILRLRGEVNIPETLGTAVLDLSERLTASGLRKRPEIVKSE